MIYIPDVLITSLSRSSYYTLQVVEEMKLGGYQLRTDLRTISNTNYIVKRAWKKMWVVRRLKALVSSNIAASHNAS